MGGTLPALADARSDYADEIFARADANSDGAISKAEFLERSEKRFSQMDMDGDWEVSQEELHIMRGEMVKESSSGHGAKILARADANSDGAISKAEFLEYLEKKFAKIDMDGDGGITKKEAKKHHAEIIKKLEKLKEKHRQ